MAMGRGKRGFLQVLQHTLNPVTLRLAHWGHGPFSLIRHVGRKSGRTYETPVILARVPEGFVAELTYGPEVSWYRNIIAAGGCTVVFGGVDHHIVAVEPYATDDGLRAFGTVKGAVLRLLHRRDFRLLRESR
ncbi:nitroreductase family deazaflavin-dependent oxidoreductase [Glaciibacter flavus]|uniref:Nitroreductase family deazaflavin-dependent oxidoreductase n=2 Tax=Orlajensenia flava TaxID=2565934 RepID=A0A4S4FZ29_9MICO|nr:nitroreductase family deazaflavin-dependent oxidoreductase [Glaciibacter flavus]